MLAKFGLASWLSMNGPKRLHADVKHRPKWVLPEVPLDISAGNTSHTANTTNSRPQQNANALTLVSQFCVALERHTLDSVYFCLGANDHCARIQQAIECPGLRRGRKQAAGIA